MNVSPIKSNLEDVAPISIAMATYNGAAYLPEQLETLALQTRLPCELVVSDDCSTDDTISVLESFSRSSPFPVRIHRNDKRLGYPANFMRAAQLCTGDMIAFCDQDDLWDPTKLARIATEFSDDDVLLVHHNAEIVDKTGKLLGHMQSRALRSSIAPPLSTDPWLPVPGFAQVFRRGLLELTDNWPFGQDENAVDYLLGHDEWTMFLSSCLGKISYVETPLVNYRQHETNAEGWSNPQNTFIRLKYILENRADVFVRLAVVAKKYAETLRTMSLGGQGRICLLAERASYEWQLLAKFYDQRARMYRSTSLSARARALLALVRLNAYSANGIWSFGRKALLKDLVLGVMFAPLTRRYGFRPSGGDHSCRRVGRYPTRAEAQAVSWSPADLSLMPAEPLTPRT